MAAAEQAYIEVEAEVRSALSELLLALNKGRPCDINWGNVGDMQRLLETIRAAIAVAR